MHKSIFSPFLLLLICITEILPFEIKLQNIHLTQTNIKLNWDNKLAKFFPANKSEPVTGIDFWNVGTDIEGFKKILEYNLKDLKQMNLTAVRMTDDLFKIIIDQPFFKNLEILKLSSCYLHSSDLQLLDEAPAQWRYLDISNNQIDGEGIMHLASIPMNLTTLKITQAYLYEEQSVQALISLGLSNLENLQLSSTSLTSDGLLKILNACDTSKIVNLTIDNNNYPVSFYESLTKISFPNLKVFGLNGLLIDEQGAIVLSKWHLPSLQFIDFSRNFFRTSEAKMFFNKAVMPKLNRISLNLNMIDAQIFRHFNSEGFLFEFLSCQVAGLGSQVFVQLSESNLSKLQQLYIDEGIGQPHDFQLFLNKSDLSSLKKMSFQNFLNLGDAFAQLLKKNLPKLEVLTIPNSGEFTLPKKQEVIFPSLKQLSLNLLAYDKQFIKNFILKIQKFAPQLKTLNLAITSMASQDLYFDMKKGGLQSIPKKLNINGVFSGMSVTLEPESKPKVRSMDYEVVKELEIDYINELQMKHLRQSEYYKQLQKQKQDIPISLASRFDFSELITLGETKQLELLGILLGKDRQYIQLAQQSLSLNLQELIITELTEKQLKILEQVQFPSMIGLTLSPKESFEKYFKKQKHSVNLQNFRDLSTFTYVGNSVSPEFCIWIFQQINFKRLYSLALVKAALKESSYQKIINKLQNYERFVSLELGGNLFRSVKSIFDEDMKLLKLSLDANVIGPNLNELSHINYNFLRDLSMSSCQIDDNSFIKYLQQRKKTSGLAFPKLRSINLQSNYIQIDGFRSLFEIGLPLIHDLSIQRNNDPEIFNTIFQSPDSRRLQIFSTQDNQLGSISIQIPSSHTRKLVSLMFQTQGLSDSDFSHLQRLQLSSLLESFFILEKIGSCQTLSSIRNITKNNKIIQILFQDETLPTLNDQCLTEEGYVANTIPEILIFQNPGYYYNLQKFAGSFVNKNHDIVQFIMIGPGCPSNEKMLEFIRTSALTNLEQFVALYCDFNDTVIRQFLRKKLPVIDFIFFKGDQELTGAALQTMNGQYHHLKVLDFSHTCIGDQGIQNIVKNTSFPYLSRLNLIDVDMTSIGIGHLRNLNAPQLQVLDISCNNLEFDDIRQLYLPYEKFPMLRAIVIYPTISQEFHKRLVSVINRNRPYQVQILSYVEYIVEDQMRKSESIGDKQKYKKKEEDKKSKKSFKDKNKGNKGVKFGP